jgi:hypothetical protein
MTATETASGAAKAEAFGGLVLNVLVLCAGCMRVLWRSATRHTEGIRQAVSRAGHYPVMGSG